MGPVRPRFSRICLQAPSGWRGFGVLRGKPEPGQSARRNARPTCRSADTPLRRRRRSPTAGHPLRARGARPRLRLRRRGAAQRARPLRAAAAPTARRLQRRGAGAAGTGAAPLRPGHLRPPVRLARWSGQGAFFFFLASNFFTLLFILPVSSNPPVRLCVVQIKGGST